MPVAKPSTVPRWASLIAWQATHYYTVGERATNDGGKIYQVTVAGTSAGVGGPTGNGGAIVDGTVTWMYVAVNAPAWVALTAYAEGDRVVNGGNTYLCTIAGTSAGAGGPSGTAGTTPPDPTIVDGTVGWIWIASAEAVITDPPVLLKDVGWVPAQKPPAQYFDWWMNLVFLWILYLQDLANQAFNWQALHQFFKGIIVGNSTAAGSGVDSTGGAGGTGVRARGGAGGGAGLVANGDGAGAGVFGLGGSSGIGVMGLPDVADKSLAGAFTDSSGVPHATAGHYGLPDGRRSEVREQWEYSFTKNANGRLAERLTWTYDSDATGLGQALSGLAAALGSMQATAITPNTSLNGEHTRLSSDPWFAVGDDHVLEVEFEFRANDYTDDREYWVGITDASTPDPLTTNEFLGVQLRPAAGGGAVAGISRAGGVNTSGFSASVPASGTWVKVRLYFVGANVADGPRAQVWIDGAALPTVDSATLPDFATNGGGFVVQIDNKANATVAGNVQVGPILVTWTRYLSAVD